MSHWWKCPLSANEAMRRVSHVAWRDSDNNKLPSIKLNIGYLWTSWHPGSSLAAYCCVWEILDGLNVQPVSLLPFWTSSGAKEPVSWLQPLREFKNCRLWRWWKAANLFCLLSQVRGMQRGWGWAIARNTGNGGQPCLAALQKHKSVSAEDFVGCS